MRTCNTVHGKMILAILVFIASCAEALPRPANELSLLNLTIIHVNDIHAHFEEVNENTTRCREENACFGGIARMVTKKNEILDEDSEALFLNAGDFYQGTVWYTKFKYHPMIEFGNLLNYTAMGLGNHDFDDSIVGIAPFAEQTTFDLLAANIQNNLLDGSFTEGEHYNKSTIKEVRGVKVGIIGYITQSTSYNFPNGSLIFEDEIKAVQEEARRLKNEGVSVIIALGHSGYEIDIQLAESIPELDLVVGGHSHTFLYTDREGRGMPSNDKPQGDYPTYVQNRVQDKVIPVVQAFCYTKYMGHMKLSFDQDGELLTPVNGTGVSFAEPLLLDENTIPDNATLEAMVKWQNNLTEYREVVGVNTVYMGKSEIDSKESNIGDFLCDAYASEYNDSVISFGNNGGIREDFPVGNITYEDVLSVQPFDNTVDKVVMAGEGIKRSLEAAAASIDFNNPDGYPGFGFQVTGLRFNIMVGPDNVNNRITNLQVKSEDGGYSSIVYNQNYTVVLPSFLAGGGSRKNQKQMRGIFDNNILEHHQGDRFIFEVVRDYFKATSPVEQHIEGRFHVIVDGDATTSTTTTTTTTPSNTSTFVISPALLFSIVMLKMWNQ